MSFVEIYSDYVYFECHCGFADVTGTGLPNLRFGEVAAQLCWDHRRSEGALVDEMVDTQQWSRQLFGVETSKP